MVFVRPHGKDVDVRLLVDLRRMLRNAGLEPPSTRGERHPCRVAAAKHGERPRGDSV